jgi:hypothetical protein
MAPFPTMVAFVGGREWTSAAQRRHSHVPNHALRFSGSFLSLTTDQLITDERDGNARRLMGAF